MLPFAPCLVAAYLAFLATFPFTVILAHLVLPIPVLVIASSRLAVAQADIVAIVVKLLQKFSSS